MRKEIFVALFIAMLAGACIGPSDDTPPGDVVGDQEIPFATPPSPTTPPPYDKVKDDPNFEAVIDSYEMAGDDLKVTFHHDAPSPQPVRVEGDLLDYELDLDTLGPGEEGALTIFEYRGQKFELHVGAESEVFSFGNVEVDHDETFGAGTVYRNTETGETTLVVDGTKWNYMGGDGRWRRVKTAIKANASREGYDYSSEQGQYKAFFKSDLSGGQSIRYENENGYATMQPRELTWRAYPIDKRAKKAWIKEEPIGKAADSRVSGEAAEDRFTYRDVFLDGIDLEYRYQPERLKEILVIPDNESLPQPTIFDTDSEDIFLMYHEVLTIPKDARIFIETGYRGEDGDDETEFLQEGVDEVFRTSEPIIIRNAQGEEILTIPEPLAWDSEGDEVIFRHSLERKNKKVYYHTEVPLGWLNDENTSYPVYIDANLVVSGTTNTLWGTKTYTDVYIINGGVLKIADFDGVWPLPGSGEEPKGHLSITATEEIRVDSTSMIDGREAGYRGGSGGGYMGTVYDGEGNGYGHKDDRHPGWGGSGSMAMVGQHGRAYDGVKNHGEAGVTYGSNTDMTFYMGSGGGGGGSNSVGDDWLGGGTGGDGGGALYLEASMLWIEPDGAIDVSGGRGSYGGSYGGAGGAGSGGTIIINAGDVIISEAKIIAAGNGGHQWDCNPKGCYPKLDNACSSGGRIKIFYSKTIGKTDAEIRTWDNQLSVENPQYFGTNGQHACNHVLGDPADKYTIVWTGNTYIEPGAGAVEHLYVPEGETYTMAGAHTYDICFVWGTLFVAPFNGVDGGTLDLTCTNRLDMRTGAKIDGQGAGHLGGAGELMDATGDDGTGLGFGTGGVSSAGGGGAGYEGSGGTGGKVESEWGTDGANNYDAQVDTCPMGSGGGQGGGASGTTGGAGGDGGACVKITSPLGYIDGFIDVSGHPGANGAAVEPLGGGGAGSGGTINLHIDDLTVGPNAKLYARGYSGGYGGMAGTGDPGGWGGAGAGGRILARYVTLTQDPLADIKATPDGSTFLAPDNSPPEAQNIQVDGKSSEPDISHITNHNPSVSWTFYDLDAGDTQSAYEVEVWTGAGGTGTQLFDTGKLSSQGNTVNLVGVGFVDGQTYYVRITLWDSSDMGSSWAEKAFKFNTPPTTPPSCGIDEGIQDAELGQLLGVDTNLDGKHFITWSASSDPGDSITYEYWVRTTPTSAYYFGPLSVVGGTQSATGFPVSDGQELLVYVRASDGYENSTECAAGFIENSLPTVQAPIVDGLAAIIDGLVSGVADPTPVFNWTYTDPEGHAQKSYQVKVASSQAFTNILWDSGVIAGSATSIEYPAIAPPLAAGTGYWTSIQAYDGHEWNDPIYFGFQLNNLPPAPSITSPADRWTGNSHFLSWTSVADPDGDAVRYYWQVTDTPGNYSSPYLVAWGETTALQGPAFGTADGQQYGARVRGCDSYACGDWSAEATFLENTRPAPPAPTFTGIKTGNLQKVTWGFSTDAEGDAIAGYDWAVSTAAGNFSVPLASGNTFGLEGTAFPTANGAEYFYRVRAFDGYEHSNWSEASFTENTPPPIPVQVSPLDGSFLGTLAASLEVAPVTDAEGTQVEYRFYLDAVNGSTLYTSSTSPTLTASNLTGGKTYFWKAAAHDGYEEGLPSPVWALTTDILPPTLLGSSTEPYNASTYLFKSRWEDPGSGVESAWLVLNAQAYQAAYDGAEYVATLSGLSSGIYTYTWHARDNAGNEQASPPYQFEVLEYTNFTIQASDLLVQPGEQITLTGRVQRSDGFYPALVDIYDGQSFVTTSSVSQVDGSFSALLTLDLGTHSIRATVSDVNGITGESNTIDAITVKGLSINITITDDVVMPGEPFTIKGAARYSDGTYPPQVDLYVDNQFVGKINVSAPGSILEAYMISAVGMHNIRVELTDADGIRGSDSAMVNVKSLSIDAELSTASILHFESSQLSGYAYYSDGSHPGTVDIHINGGLHAAVNVYEFGFYSYTISGLGVGDYTIVVKHRDADGISGASSPLTLSVGDNPPTQNTQIVIENTTTSANGTLVVHDDQPTLTWTGGTDPDGDVVYTQITVSALAPGGAEVLNASTAESNYTLPKLDFQKTYYVRMQTYSGTGVASEPYDFVIETTNSPPTGPGPFSPTKTRNPSPTITWIVGVDPDGDAVNTLITVQGMQTVEASGGSYQLPELQLGAYTIAMQSEDPFGAVSATIEGTIEILPTNISLVQPISGEQLSSTAVLKTDVSGDVDRVIYYYSQDNGVTWVQIGQSLSQESPYTILWDTTKAANGPAVVKVTMIDLYGRTYEDFSEEVYIQNKAPATGAKYSRVFGDGTGAYEGGEEAASPVVAVLFFIVIMGAIASALSALVEYVKLPGHLSIGGKLERMSKENIYILAFLGVIAVVLDIGYGVFNAGILVMMFQDIVLLTVVGILVAGLWYFRGKKPPIPAMQHRPEFLKD